MGLATIVVGTLGKKKIGTLARGALKGKDCAQQLIKWESREPKKREKKERRRRRQKWF